jgi:multiple sugar transport system substrate-binding protein
MAVGIPDELNRMLARDQIDRRSFIMKGIALGLSLPTLNAILVACGGNQTSTTETGTVSIWWNGLEPEYGPPMADLIPKFEAANPGTKVDLSIVDWGTAYDKVAAAAAAGALPDIWTLYSSDIPTFAIQDQFHPLDGLLDKSKLQPGAVEMGTWKGKWYSLVWQLDVRVFNYRKDLATQVGLDPTKPPATWDELRDWAQKLTVRDTKGNITRVGFWVSTNHPYKTIAEWQPFLTANGGRFFSQDGKTAAFNGPEGVEALTFLNDLINKYHVDFPGSTKKENVAFGQGTIAMTVNDVAVRGWVTDFPALVQSGAAGFAPVPAGPRGKKGACLTGGNCLVMSKNTKVPHLAAKLMDMLCLDPTNSITFNKLDGAPSSLLPSLVGSYTSDPFASQYAALASKYYVGYPKHPDYGGKIGDIVTKALDLVYTTNSDPKKALDDAASKVNDLLNQDGPAEETGITY